jgi:hypothetical protein
LDFAHRRNDMGDVHFTNRLSVPTLIALAGIWLSGARAASAQTTDYLYSGSETNVTLNPGIYVITAYGAPGGSYTFPNGLGAFGAEMSGEFDFSTSTNLTLLVGGRGGYAFGSSGSGGGGGSFVVEGSTPLVIAGGGGGGGANFPGQPFYGVPASVSPEGDSGTGGGGSGGSGGYGGGGGENGNFPGGGGGGFFGNGGSGNGGGPGGISFENGGYGVSNGSYGNGGYGGGGGGGGLNYYFGGGGGGGGSSYANGYAGGGGGSIIDSSAIMDLAEVYAIQSPDDPDNGEIIITEVPEPASLGLLGGCALLMLRRRPKFQRGNPCETN